MAIRNDFDAPMFWLVLALFGGGPIVIAIASKICGYW